MALRFGLSGAVSSPITWLLSSGPLVAFLPLKPWGAGISILGSSYVSGVWSGVYVYAVWNRGVCTLSMLGYTCYLNPKSLPPVNASDPAGFLGRSLKTL